MDKLVTAETISAGRLREAATIKSDESILIHIADKDCAALEVKYHKQCYKQYTSFLRDEPKSDAKQLCKYEEAFGIFCETFVNEKIIQKGKIYFMNKVREKFVRTVEQVEGVDASNYKKCRLKERLRERFPNLVFHTPKERNKSEIVFAECLSKGNVAESFLKENDETSQSEIDSSDEGQNTNRNKLNADDKKATLKDIYYVALTLREILRSPTASWYESWPPLASDITGESVKKQVSPLLFNFVTWLLGFSNEPEDVEYVEVEENVAVKVFSICQDLVYVCNKGRIQTPKSLALAMTVRQISGCSNLIKILNGLGHCVSLPATMAYDSALAQLSMNTSSYLPKDFVKNEYVNLVYDNIDFGEEIAKQTHVTNGIITQKVIVIIIITTLVHIYKSAILPLHFVLQNLKNILHILFR